MQTIDRFDRADRRRLTTFVRSWSAQECYDRFGSTGRASPAWLVDRLTSSEDHRAFVARDDRDYVALLDYVVTERGIEFGIFVQATHRRRQIATRLVRALLALRSPSQKVLAQTRLENAAAVGLLRSCGFAVVAMEHGEVDWELQAQ
jgi:GNAT superfamily N-acetyltransferase